MEHVDVPGGKYVEPANLDAPDFYKFSIVEVLLIILTCNPTLLLLISAILKVSGQRGITQLLFSERNE